MSKLTIPTVSVSADLLEWVRQVINLSSRSGFFAAYHYNLIIHKKKGLAYEATEELYEVFYGRRKYPDREVFYVRLSEWKREQKLKKAECNNNCYTT